MEQQKQQKNVNHEVIFSGKVKKRTDIPKKQNFAFRKRFFELTTKGIFIFETPKKKSCCNSGESVIIFKQHFQVSDIAPNCIKINRNTTCPLYFKLKSVQEMVQWIIKLEEVGGIRIKNENTQKKGGKSNHNSMKNKRVKDWNNKNVLEWLSYYSFGKEYFDQFKGITGKKLINLKITDLEQLKIKEIHRSLLLEEIAVLKKYRFFNAKEKFVYSKIENCIERDPKSKFRIKRKKYWNYFIAALSRPKVLKERYFNTRFVSDKIYNKYVPDEDIWKIWNKKDKKIEIKEPCHIPQDICWQIMLFLDEVSEVINVSAINHEFFFVSKKEMFWKEYGMNLYGIKSLKNGETWREAVKNKFLQSHRKKKRINLNKKKKILIKIVISEHKRFKNIENFFSPVLKRIPEFNEKEIKNVYSSLIVGKWYLEWTDSGLIVPKLLDGEMGKLLEGFNVTCEIKTSIEDVTTKLANLICKWNTTYNYPKDELQSFLPSSRNCQDFVEECLEVLKAPKKWKKNGVYSNFLDQIQIKGKGNLIFKPEKHFKSHFNLLKESYQFSKHQELDDFINESLTFERFHRSYHCPISEEKKLLLAFDHVFWLRHLSNQNQENWKPKSCYFDDPKSRRTTLTNDNWEINETTSDTTCWDKKFDSFG